MAGRNSHFSNASIFSSFLIAGIVLLLLPTSFTSKISLFFYNTFESVLQVGRDMQMDALRLPPNREETVSRNDYAKLWKSYKNLHAQLKTVHQECERLAKVRAALPQSFSGLVMARITGTGNYSHEVIINKGSNALIRPGQYVLSEQKDCLVGVVSSEVSETAAKVRLLTDAMQSLEIRIRRDRTDKDIGAMMFGDGKGACRISMIDRQEDVREGDTVYAAAVPNKLDIPLVVGEVVEVTTDEHHPLLWDITVMPAEDMARLNDIAVIIADETLLKGKD